MFPIPIICCISEGDADESNFTMRKRKIVGKAAIAAEHGIAIFQLREKRLPASLLFDLAQAVAEAVRGTEVKILVNGRADIALAAGAHGVHLPADGLSAAEVRRHLPEPFIIGVSTHSISQAEAAKTAGADFVVFGPVFSSPGKNEPVGIDQLREVCSRVHPFPVLALGGIQVENTADVLANGAAGYAAIRYLNGLMA